MAQSSTSTSNRANALAERLLKGANALATYAEGLSEDEWQTPVIGDGRPVGVVVHHVASVYPIEVELAQLLAKGEPITEATPEVINQMNANHAQEYKNVCKQETLELLKKNSKIAANSIREFADEDLDSAATVSLNANAPLTAQFFIEDHALRHSFHHLAKIKTAIGK